MENRVCTLYRVSTDKQVDHNDKNQADIPMQRKACHAFCEKMGWVIVHEEQEEGVSGHKVRAENVVWAKCSQGAFPLFEFKTHCKIGSRW